MRVRNPSVTKKAGTKFFGIIHMRKTSIKGSIMQVNVIYALKPEKWHNMQYKILTKLYAIKTRKSSKYALCMIYFPKGQNMQTCLQEVRLFGIIKP